MVGTAVASTVVLRAVMRRVEKRAMREVMCLNWLRGVVGSGRGSAAVGVIEGCLGSGAGMIASSWTLPWWWFGCSSIVYVAPCI